MKRIYSDKIPENVWAEVFGRPEEEPRTWYYADLPEKYRRTVPGNQKVTELRVQAVYITERCPGLGRDPMRMPLDEFNRVLDAIEELNKRRAKDDDDYGEGQEWTRAWVERRLREVAPTRRPPPQQGQYPQMGYAGHFGGRPEAVQQQQERAG